MNFTPRIHIEVYRVFPVPLHIYEMSCTIIGQEQDLNTWHARLLFLLDL